MKTYQIGELMSDEDSLAHYGVPGMKWGVRKFKDYRNSPDSSGVSRKQARYEIKKGNRKLDRKLEDFESSPKRSDLIRSARQNQTTAKRKYEDVKSEIKNQKSAGALGKNAARVMLNQAKNERYENIHMAESKTMGEQFIDALFAPREPRTA